MVGNTSTVWGRLLVALGLRRAVSGAALHATTGARFVDVFPGDEGGWYFSWFDENHERGETKGPFMNERDAEIAKQAWILGTHGKLIILPAVKA